MDERLKTNLAKWNAVVPVHARSQMYDVGGFKAGSVKHVAAAVGEGAQVVAALHAYLAAPEDRPIS